SGPPRRFELGMILPPHVRRSLSLSSEQEREIKQLEAEVKAKLNRILTAEQKKTVAEARPPAGVPGGPPDDGPGGPPGDDGKKRRAGDGPGPGGPGDKQGPPPGDKDGGAAAPAA